MFVNESISTDLCRQFEHLVRLLGTKLLHRLRQEAGQTGLHRMLDSP